MQNCLILLQTTHMKPACLFLLVLIFSGCNILGPNHMFKTPPDYTYSDFSEKKSEEYRVAPNDLLELRVYTNDGLKLVDLLPQSSNTGNLPGISNNAIEFLVDKEGFVRLPTIGNMQVKDLTIRQAQTKIEEAFAEFYIKPYALIRVLNRRVIVFPGNGGTGTVVPLKNENTSLIEVLALAGGIAQNGKSNRVKLVRGPINMPEIQLIDLSTVEGMKKANITIQANDIVYVEPVRNISQNLLAQITPIVALLSATLFIIQLSHK